MWFWLQLRWIRPQLSSRMFQLRNSGWDRNRRGRSHDLCICVAQGFLDSHISRYMSSSHTTQLCGHSNADCDINFNLYNLFSNNVIFTCSLLRHVLPNYDITYYCRPFALPARCIYNLFGITKMHMYNHSLILNKKQFKTKTPVLRARLSPSKTPTQPTQPRQGRRTGNAQEEQQDGGRRTAQNEWSPRHARTHPQTPLPFLLSHRVSPLLTSLIITARTLQTLPEMSSVRGPSPRYSHPSSQRVARFTLVGVPSPVQRTCTEIWRRNIPNHANLSIVRLFKYHHISPNITPVLLS